MLTTYTQFADFWQFNVYVWVLEGILGIDLILENYFWHVAKLLFCFIAIKSTGCLSI